MSSLNVLTSCFAPSPIIVWRHKRHLFDAQTQPFSSLLRKYLCILFAEILMDIGHANWFLNERTKSTTCRLTYLFSFFCKDFTVLPHDSWFIYNESDSFLNLFLFVFNIFCQIFQHFLPNKFNSVIPCFSLVNSPH